MKINNFILAILIGLVASFIFFGASSTSQVYAAAKDDVCQGIGGCAQRPGAPNVNNTLTKVINLLSALIGITAVIMVMVGGFKYIISSGDSNSATSAKNTIIYALVGLAIAALAQVLVHFVLNNV